MSLKNRLYSWNTWNFTLTLEDIKKLKTMKKERKSKSEVVETLRIQVEWQDAPWLRACPFHESQVEEVCAEDYSVFAYRLAITPEVMKRLEMIKDYIEILEPRAQWAREPDGDAKK